MDDWYTDRAMVGRMEVGDRFRQNGVLSIVLIGGYSAALLFMRKKYAQSTTQDSFYDW